MSIKQISVFVENKPGSMNAMTKVLADNNIDMRALSLAETIDFGIVRIIVDDVFTAATVLKGIFSGTNLALLGAALAVALPCMGSAKGVGIVGEASSGLISENPSLFGKALALQALPMTQGVYGLVAAFLMLAMLGLFGNPEHLTSLPINAGAYYLMASLPIALSGYFSAVRQGRVSAAGINLLSKRPAESGKAITSSALVETYAIFALLITLLLVFFSPFNA